MKKSLIFLIPVLFAALAFQTLTTEKKAPVVTTDVKSRIDATLKNFVDSSKIIGVSALIFENGKEAYFNAFGYADKEANKKMDRNTIVRIYSMTKPVAGVALMTLYEKGLFKLDDPLSKYAPEFTDMKVFKGMDAGGNPILEPAKRPITIRDITRHTAGFSSGDNPVLAGMVRKADVSNSGNTLSELAKRWASLPLQFHPGEEWAYGPSVDIQAYLVEKLSGKPFDQYLKETIFDPLGMKDTGYLIPENERYRFSAVYTRSNEGVLTRQPDEQANATNTKPRTLKQGSAGLVSTVDDYMKFAQMLVHKGQSGKVRILKPETVELMSTNQLDENITKRMWLPSKGQVGFGIDFAVRLRNPKTKSENNGAIGEFFWDGAYSTLFWVDPANDLTAVLFTQLTPFDKVQLHKRFRDSIYGAYDPSKEVSK